MPATLAQPIWAVTPQKIQEAVRRLVEAACPVRIIMFGSQARGEDSQDSDLDLVVVERIEAMGSGLKIQDSPWMAGAAVSSQEAFDDLSGRSRAATAFREFAPGRFDRRDQFLTRMFRQPVLENFH
jgi:hypothetical protein